MIVDKKNNKTLILGLGNTILSDDATGIIVAQEVYENLLKAKHCLDVEVAQTSYAGWRLIDLISGYKKVVIIDAIQGGAGAPGDCYEIEKSKINSLHLQSAHGMDLNTSLELAKKSGIEMPQEISVYAVEVKNPFEFGEKISPEVKSKIPEIARAIMQKEFLSERRRKKL